MIGIFDIPNIISILDMQKNDKSYIVKYLTDTNDVVIKVFYIYHNVS